MTKLHRRSFLGAACASMAAMARAQSVRSVQTPTLEIAYEESGNPQGFPIVLLHGFPDDAHAYDDVAPPLAKAGHRVLVPYLRGYGPTRFRDANAPRKAEQAAIGQDRDRLRRRSRISAIRGCRVRLGRTRGGDCSGIASRASSGGRFHRRLHDSEYFCRPPPAPPEVERELWYQWYFNTERGRAGLAANRRSLCKLLWQTWSPTGTSAMKPTMPRRLPSTIPISWMWSSIPIDIATETRRAKNVFKRWNGNWHSVRKSRRLHPLYGANDVLVHPSPDVTPAERTVFPSLIARRVIPGAGHFMPREKPEAVSSALLDLL